MLVVFGGNGGVEFAEGGEFDDLCGCLVFGVVGPVHKKEYNVMSY